MPQVPKPDLSDGLVAVGTLIAGIGLYELAHWSAVVLFGLLVALVGLRLSAR